MAASQPNAFPEGPGHGRSRTTGLFALLLVAALPAADAFLLLVATNAGPVIVALLVGKGLVVTAAATFYLWRSLEQFYVCRFLSRTIEAMHEVVFVTDPAGRFRFICPNIERLSGVTVGAVAQAGNAGQVFDPDPGAGLAETRDGLLKNQPTRFVLPDGTTHELLLNVSRCDVLGDSRLYVGRPFSTFDFTSKLLHRIFWHSHDAIICVSRTGSTVVNCNAATGRIFGFKRGELIGKSTETLHVDHESFVRFGEISGPEIEQQGFFQGEYRMRHRDGHRIDVDIRTVAVDGGDASDFGFISILHDVTKRRAAERSARESREALRMLARRQESLQEAERKHFARELHDQLGSDLTGLKMKLGFARTILEGSDEARQQFDEAQSIVDSLASAVSDMAGRLRPAVLDVVGLGAGIGWLVDRHSGAGDCRIVAQDLDDSIVLGDPATTALFRICQESLTNVLRHAGATEARVSLVADDGRVTLTVADDGRGMDESRLASGDRLGIIGMRERMEAIDGRFEIRSKPGEGTTVIASVRYPG